MFTGLIESVQEYEFNNNQLIFKNLDYWNDVSLGDSISVNGVCLTVAKIDEFITFDLLNETVSITNLKVSKLANLEKSMIFGKRYSGHFVLGHVVEMGIIKCISDNIFTIEVPSEKYLKIKDSITVNGVSLTIQKIKNLTFEVHIIPHTLNQTTFKYLKIDDPVNIEYSNLLLDDTHFMNLALKESLKGKFTAPNPRVGCVIVKNNQVVGSGYHRKCGEPHAEANALNNLIGNDLTMYVTLEPCCHYGKTGPCCELIIKSGVTKVVIGILDPDTRVSGKGVKFLENHGIEVIVGCCASEIKESLKSYIHSRMFNMPLVIAKIVLSKEGNYCVENKNISLNSKEEQLKYHYLRAESQCIIIGSKTAVIDNPQLTVRNGEQHTEINPLQTGFLEQRNTAPLRVVIDSKGIVRSSNLMKPGTIIFTSKSVSQETLIYWENVGVKYHFLTEPEHILKLLYNTYGVLQCLLEGGGELQKVFNDLDLIDSFVIIKTETSLPEGKPWSIIPKNSNKSIEYFKRGGMVLVMDDYTRENEGDLIVNAEYITEEMITFIKRYTTGIICVTLTEQRALELGLSVMVINNTDPHATAFTITCDSMECSTGVSSKDRLLTIKTILNGTSESLSKPGHIFPLIAKSGGLSERRGHTEASIDLCKLSGLSKVAVICELTNDDGTMMKLKDINLFASKWNIPVITTEQIYQLGLKKGIYKGTAPLQTGFLEQRNTAPLYDNIKQFPVSFEAKCDFTTRDYGCWQLMSYNTVYGTLKVLQLKLNKTRPLVRIHSECFTGDVLNSSHCDCGSQLRLSMELIYKNGNGVIIFPCNHEGRGIGFTNKIRAYDLMNKDSNLNTYSANLLLGFKEDLRDYSYCIDILKDLCLDSFVLLTTNPEKIKALSAFDVTVQSLQCGQLPFNEYYLTTKAKKHGTFKFVEKKIGIVHSSWYSDLIGPFVQSIKMDIPIYKIIAVPGSFEIPLVAKQMCEYCDIVVCIGAIIKGDTYHFECMSHTICDALMEIQLSTGKPILNYILNCYTIGQVEERLKSSNSLLNTLKYFC